MKALDIVKQLHALLPQFTDYFSDTLAYTSITGTGNTVTFTMTSPHGLQNGQTVIIGGAKRIVNITTLAQVNGTATAITDTDHDLTDGFQDTVIISGADQAGYNGEHNLYTVPNRYEFTCQVNPMTVSPATGTIRLYDTIAYAYNGPFVVSNVTDTTFDITFRGDFEHLDYSELTIRARHRIAPVIDQERMQALYTRQPSDKLWAFVVLGEAVVSKDRTSLTDAIGEQQSGSQFRQKVIQGFSIYVVVPTTQLGVDASGARDLIEDITVPLYRSILRVKFDSPYNGDISLSMLRGHNIYQFVNSYYIHQFDFELLYYLTYLDTVPLPFSRAFRDIELRIEAQTNTDVIATALVNLDDDAR